MSQSLLGNVLRTPQQHVQRKIVSDRIGHANMAYTLSIYTHRSTGKDKTAAKKIADVIFGDGWQGPPDPHNSAA